MNVASISASPPPLEPPPEEARPAPRDEPARPAQPPAPQPEYSAQNVDLFA